MKDCLKLSRSFGVFPLLHPICIIGKTCFWNNELLPFLMETLIVVLHACLFKQTGHLEKLCKSVSHLFQRL